MQLKSLKIFCDVVHRRSFSRAADENGISQSGASQVVNQLESRLGVKLLDRSKRPFSLTPEGEIYYEGCRKLVERYFVLEDEVRTLHEEVAGRVRVASIYSVGLHHMNRFVREFTAQYPKTNVKLEYLHPHRVYEAVDHDQADVGLVSYPKSTRTLKATEWRKEPMVLVCAPQHRLAGKTSIRLEELAGEKIVNFNSDLTIRHEIDRILHLHRVEVQVVLEFDNIETLKRAIEIESGVGILPEPTIRREVAAGTLAAVPLETDELVRPLGIVHRRGKEMGVAVRRFIDFLRSQPDKTGQPDIAAQPDAAAVFALPSHGNAEALTNGANGHANSHSHPTTTHGAKRPDSYELGNGRAADPRATAGSGEDPSPMNKSGAERKPH